MEIEDVIGVKFGTENEIDMEEKDRGWDLKDIGGDSLTLSRAIWHACACWCLHATRHGCVSM
jgi:hypothetical protein